MFCCLWVGLRKMRFVCGCNDWLRTNRSDCCLQATTSISLSTRDAQRLRPFLSRISFQIPSAI
jgi:hypothetical protein